MHFQSQPTHPHNQADSPERFRNQYLAAGTMYSGKQSLGPAGRPEMKAPTEDYAQKLSQQTTRVAISTSHSRLEASDVRHPGTEVPQDIPREARQAMLWTILLGAQYRSGQKRPLVDHDAEATAEEPLRKRTRAKAAVETDKRPIARERSGRTGDGTAYECTETLKNPHKWRGSCQPNTFEGISNCRQRSNVAEKRRRRADFESPSIAPLNTRKPRGILHTPGRLRLGHRTLQKKVRFEDEVPEKVTERFAHPGQKFKDIKEETQGTGSQILHRTQHEVLDQSADEDVIMVDIARNSRHCC
jgi:hypothetical protein